MIDSERILFNRVGWMTYYGSEPSPELPVGGGEFNKREPENAAEGANFVLDDDGFAYGLIHTKTLNIRRLGVENNASYQSECTVVSVAPHPEHGLVIVGWQPKAEVTPLVRLPPASGSSRDPAVMV